jgi:3-oxoacyl-[acyl-carrier protein] reductase
MSASLKGRSVLVTGGSKGIGKGIARVFANVGAKVAIIARHGDQAEAAAKEIGHGAIGISGTFLTVQSAIPHLKKSDQGRVVITSSITGPVTGYPGWTHYGATKAGQLGFMRTACIELAKYGITVNAVMPGNIITEGLAGMGEDYQKTMAASIPLKRLGTVDDIGHAALYFASKEAGYVTGQTIVVDGGQILPESLEALAQA